MDKSRQNGMLELEKSIVNYLEKTWSLRALGLKKEDSKRKNFHMETNDGVCFSPSPIFVILSITSKA